MTHKKLVQIATLGSTLVLLGALAFQFIGGLPPCDLCITQRWPHAIAIILGVLALGTGAYWLSALGGLAALVTSGYGLYHTGIERGWWQGPTSCTSDNSALGLPADQLLDTILSAPVTRCDDILWDLFGITMASWNAAISLALAAIWFGAFVISKKKAELGRFKIDLSAIDRRFTINTFNQLAVLTLLVGIAPFLVIATLPLFGFDYWRPSDFLVFWSAGHLLHEGGATATIDLAALREGMLTGLDYYEEDYTTRGIFWFYPPTILPLIWPLGLVGSKLGNFIWIVGGFALWCAVANNLMKRLDMPFKWPVLFSPFAFVVIIYGQNGVLTAVLLLGFIFAVMEKRSPWMIGLFCAALLYKPHFGVLMPLVLILEKNWRAFGAATALSIAYLLLVTLIFKPEGWQSFLETQDISSRLLDSGAFAGAHFGNFALIKALTGSTLIANFGWIAFSLFIIMAVIDRWSKYEWDLKIAMFLIGTSLISPYSFAYDIAFYAVAIALLYPRFEAINGGRILLFLLWILPAVQLNGTYYIQINVLTPLAIATFLIVVYYDQLTSGAQEAKA